MYVGEVTYYELHGRPFRVYLSVITFISALEPIQPPMESISEAFLPRAKRLQGEADRLELIYWTTLSVAQTIQITQRINSRMITD
jgi:hypothetical protein